RVNGRLRSRRDDDDEPQVGRRERDRACVMTTPSYLRGPRASSGGGPRRRTGRLPRRSLVIGAVLFPLVVAGCGAGGSEAASVTAAQAMPRDHRIADAVA